MTRSVPCILKVNQALRFGRSIDQFVEVAPRTRGAQFRYPLTSNEKEERFSQFRKTIDEVEEIIASQDSALKAPFNGYKQRWEKQGRLALRLSQFLNAADTSTGRIYFADRAVYREEGPVSVCAVNYT